MRIEPTELEGVLLLYPDVHPDARGYFFESYSSRRFVELGLGTFEAQDNESMSARGVVRGLHYQLAPHAQAKLVRAVAGRIFDVVVDVRRSSPTFGCWTGRILDGENHAMLYIPQGFAHGFSVLEGPAVVQYKCDAPWHPASERGISYRDATLAIDWLLDGIEPLVSPKDEGLPCLQEAELAP